MRFWFFKQHPLKWIPREAQVPLALECLYIYIPIGRRLGMNSLATRMEEYCMEILFPASHAESETLLREACLQSEGKMDGISFCFDTLQVFLIMSKRL